MNKFFGSRCTPSMPTGGDPHPVVGITGVDLIDHLQLSDSPFPPEDFLRTFLVAEDYRPRSSLDASFLDPSGGAVRWRASPAIGEGSPSGGELGWKCRNFRRQVDSLRPHQRTLLLCSGGLTLLNHESATLWHYYQYPLRRQLSCRIPP
jgi:hypothetical protein